MLKVASLHLFGSSGFRGVFNSEATPELIYKICYALALSLGGGDVLVGWDTRTTSPLLALNASSGLVAGGSHAKLVGLIPTPGLAYVSRLAKAGVMITASHNPPEYNGIKLFNSDSSSYSPGQYLQVEQKLDDLPREISWKSLGCFSYDHEQVNTYLDALLRGVSFSRNFSIVLDPGGGAMCGIARNVLRQLGCSIHAINDMPDGFFKSRPSEPSESTLGQLSAHVKLHSAQGGFAYDGDGDRVVAVDERGRYVSPDSLIASYANYLIRKRKGIVVVNVDTSACVDKAVEEAGGKTIRARVGDVFVAEKIKLSSAIFGAEPCGAWIHPDFSLSPDGLLSTIRLLNALDEEDVTLSEFSSRFKPGVLIRDKIFCKNELKNKAMLKISAELDKLDYVKREIVDGVWLCFEDYSWLLVRPSGTEPYLRITVESGDPHKAQHMMDLCRTIVARSLEALQ